MALNTKDNFKSSLFTDLNNFKIHEPHFVGGVKLFPVSFEKPSLNNKISLLDDSFDKNEIEAFEVSSEGVVGQVGIKNKSESFVLILDGEAISGAKQNRISQTTIILNPFSETIIPVNCIERGRWSYSSDRTFNKSEYSISPKMRDRKAEILKTKEVHKLQSTMWNEIDELSEKFETKSFTDDLGEVLDYAGRESDFEDINKKLDRQCNGYIVFGTERPFIELFGNNSTRKHYMKKNIKSWIADAENSEVKHIDPGYLLEKYLNSSWHQDKSFGAEKSYQTNDLSNGRSYFLNNEFIHSYYFF